MIPDAPQLFGAAQDPLRHRELADEAAVRAELGRGLGVNDLWEQRGVIPFAHIADAYQARVWLAEAAAVAAGSIDLMAPEAQRAEVVRAWQAFANFWRCLNISPYGWRPLRWQFEDLLGYPRAAEDRGLTEAEVIPAETAAHYRGQRASRVETDGRVSFTQPVATWESGRSAEICELDRDGAPAGPCETVREQVARPGLWHEGARRWFRAGEAVRFGVSPWEWVDTAGFGSRAVGIPPNREADNANNNTGEVHRLWLWNNATLGVHPAMRDPASHGFDPARPWTDDGVPVEASSGRRGAAEAVPDTPFVLPPSRWYFDLLRAPRVGLRAAPNGPDLSLVDYLLARSPAEVIREVRRDVMLTNTLTQRAARAYSPAELFTRSQRDEMERQQRAATDTLEGAQRDRNTTSTILTAAATAATAINPVLGVVVGVGSLIFQAGRAASERQSVTSTRFADVFGRLSPAYEQFAIEDSRPTLVASLAALGLPPGAAPDPEEVRRRREATGRDFARRVDAVRGAFGADGALSTLFVASQRAAFRRSVMLTGLDPVQGARVFIGDREYTTGIPELGGARWVDANGVAAWYFGVPEGATALRVQYPSGLSRTLELPPVAPMNESDATPEARMAVLDAAPPVSDAPNEGVVTGYPSRTVVLAGLARAPMPRITVNGEDVATTPAPTGDAARWIDSTVQGVPGYLFGVPTGARIVTVTDASGARAFPLAPLPLTADVRERVTVIDARRAPPRARASAALRIGLASAFAFGLYRLVRSRT